MLSCISMKQCTWQDLYQLKEHQGACQIAFLITRALAVQLLPESHFHYSGPAQASLCCCDLQKRIAKVMNDPQLQTGMHRALVLWLALFPYSFHRKCVCASFMKFFVLGVSTVEVKRQKLTDKLATFLRISLRLSYLLLSHSASCPKARKHIGPESVHRSCCASHGGSVSVYRVMLFKYFCRCLSLPFFWKSAACL